MALKLATERTDYFAAAAGLVATIICALAFDLRFAAGVLTGAGVGVLNFALMRMFVGSILTGEPSDRRRALGLLLLKILALVAVLYVLLVLVGLPVLAFGVGFLSTPLAIVVDGLVWHGRQPQPPAGQQGELN